VKDALIKNNENGLIVPICDTEKLAEAMFTILNKESLRNLFSQNLKLMKVQFGH
jgi:glycosyltransferase involved in cell wall biosynthesis